MTTLQDRISDMMKMRDKAQAKAVATGRPWMVVGLDSADDGRVFCVVEPSYAHTDEFEAFNGIANMAFLADGTEVCPYEAGLI